MASERSNNAVSKPFLETGLGKLAPEIRKMIFINLLATPPPYAGHNFAINSAGPKNPSWAPKKFIHIKASWHQVTQTCRQIYLESYCLFFASDSYYLANLQESTHLLNCGCIRNPSVKYCVLDDLGCRHVSTLPFRLANITTLCLEGFTDRSLFTKEAIDKRLSNPTDYGYDDDLTRQQLEVEIVRKVNEIACHRLRKLSNLRTVGLRMLVGEELEYVNLMYGVSGMSRGLVEFLDQSHWLIRTQHPNDIWRIQYACFTMADYGLDKNRNWISLDRIIIEEEVTEIDSRAPGLQEGDERYVEVHIQRHKRGDDVETISEVSNADLEDLSEVGDADLEDLSEVSDEDLEDLSNTRSTLSSETSDLNTTQVGELQDLPEPAHDGVETELKVPPMEMEDDLEYQGLQLPAHDGVEIELEVPPMEMEDDLDYQGFQLPAHDRVETELKVPPMEMEDDLQISPLDNSLGGNELEQEVLNTSEPFLRSQSQDKHDPQSNDHSDQKNDHALSDTASHEVSSIQSTEPSHQQAEESLLPTYSTFAWHSVLTNTDSSR